MRVARWAAVIALGCLACDKSPFSDDPPAPSEPGAPPVVRGGGGGETRRTPTLDDSGVVIERSDPPPPAGDLQTEIDAFTTLDSCVMQHANLDPLVGDALRSLGYDTLLRDACRVLQALKQKDASPCSAIAASGLQWRCESLVAMAKEAPDRCPWLAAMERTLGRDPMCLGVASHDPRLCAATFTSQRGTCEALATGDVRRCSRGTPDERQRCERELERERRVLVPPEHEAHDVAAPKGTATIKGTAGAPDPEPSELDLAADIEGGVVFAPESGGATRIDVAHDRDAGLHLPSRGGDRVRFAASVLLVDNGGIKVDKFEINAPKSMPIVCPGARCQMKAEVSKGEAKRGGPITITFDGTLDGPNGKYAIHAQIDSFIRDVVTRSQMYAPR